MKKTVSQKRSEKNSKANKEGLTNIITVVNQGLTDGMKHLKNMQVNLIILPRIWGLLLEQLVQE